MDKELLVMSSIRKPKRICFHSSDGKDNYFLVKGGEDLRNDERIEQLFVLMNSIVMNAGSQDGNTAATQEGVGNIWNQVSQARTYCVIPMSVRVGLLEWVSNTIPLKSIIAEEMTADAHFIADNFPKGLILHRITIQLHTHTT